MPRDIIALGDVHGDGDMMIKVLKRLRLISDRGNWIGGTVNLVVLGDVVDGLTRIDRWYTSTMGDVEALLFLDRLAKEAAAAGGAVTCVLGNHELFGINGTHHYVHPDDMLRAGGQEKRRALFLPGGKAFEALSRWKYVYVENNTIFCHAGIATAKMSTIHSVADLRNAPRLLPVSDIVEHRQYSPDSPAPTASALNTLRAMLDRIHLKSMVIGHNTVTKPTDVWDGMVTLADCGLSRAFSMSTEKYVVCVRPDGRKETITISQI